MLEVIRLIKDYIEKRSIICLIQIEEGQQPFNLKGQILQVAESHLIFYVIDQRRMLLINFLNIDELVEV